MSQFFRNNYKFVNNSNFNPFLKKQDEEDSRLLVDFKTVNLGNNISTDVHFNKQVLICFQYRQNLSKPKLFEKKPIYNSNYPNQVYSQLGNVAIRLQNQNQYQSWSAINNVSHSPIPDHSNNQSYLSRQNSNKNLTPKDSVLFPLYLLSDKVSQQKLSSILCFIAAKPDIKKSIQSNHKKSRELLDSSQLETTKPHRKNQSMSDLPLPFSKTPNSSPLLLTQIVQPSLTNKLKKTPANYRGQDGNVEKIRIKIQKLISELDQNDNQNLLDFNLKFGELMLQLAKTVLVSNSSISSSNYLSTLQLDNAFKQQALDFQELSQLKNEHTTLQQQLKIQVKKNEIIVKVNQQNNKQITDLKKDKQQLHQNLSKQLVENKNFTVEIKKLKQSVESLILENARFKLEVELQANKQSQGDFSEERNELKYLIQGQFEAIQKLLQREQLVKIFLRKVGDNSVLQFFFIMIFSRMFEKYIQDEEKVDPNATVGTINANLNSKNEIFHYHEEDKAAKNFGCNLLRSYEKCYKQLELRDSQLADDSSFILNLKFQGVNDSEESSFHYFGKEEATQISQWIDTAPELKQKTNRKMQLKMNLKEKLKINISELAMVQIKDRQFERKNSENSDKNPLDSYKCQEFQLIN